MWRRAGASFALAVCSVSTQCLQSFFFPASVQRVNWLLPVDLLHYLGHGSVNRHVFDLDGVCHVGEMISAPADVLKGAAGKVNHGAKAKARPAIHRHTKTHCAKHRGGDVCLFSILTHQRQNRQIQRQTHTHVWTYTHASKRQTFFFLLTPPLALTHLFCLCFDSFKHSNTRRHTEILPFSHTCIIGWVMWHKTGGHVIHSIFACGRSVEIVQSTVPSVA